MLLEVTHETDLVYSDFISESVMELRVCPDQAADQHRLSFDLAIGPPTQVSSYFDWLDNLVHTFAVTGYHDRIRIVASSVIEIDRQPVFASDLPETGDPWPFAGLDADYALYDFLQFDGPIIDCPPLRQLADDVKPVDGEPMGAVVARAMGLLHERFRYVKGVTTSASPITVPLSLMQGVCQDFTHITIGLCRALGIPARYVSGLVHSDPEPGAPTFLGDSETHAWVEVWLGSRGWVGLDPTNACGIDGHFVKVAVGRHFGDVPPNKGVYRGSGKESIRVQVRSRRLAGVPPELAAVTMRPLNLPVSEAPPTVHETDGGQQQQQQQQ